MSRRLTLILVLTFALALLLTGQPAPLAAAPPAQSSQQPPPPPPGSTSTPNPTATNTPTQTAVPVGTPTATTAPVTCPPVGLGGNYVWMVKDTQPDSPPQQYFPQGTVTVYARLCYVAQDGQPLDYVIEIYDDTVMTPLYRRAGRYPGVGYYTHPEAIDIPVLLPTARQPFRTRIIFPSLSPGAWGGDWVWAVGSSVSLDKSEYVGISEPARVTVLDPLVEDDQISVDVMSTRPDGSLISSMRLVLARTGPTGNRFEGSLTFRQNSGGMGQLLVEDGATITVRYTRPTPPIVATAVWRLPPTPSPTPTTTTTTTVTPTPSRTASPTISPTPTATLPPTRTQTPTITPTWTPGPSSTPTATPTVTLTPSLTATASPTAVPTWTPQAGTRSIVAQEGQTGYFSALQGRSVPNNLWAGVWSNGLNIHHGVAQFNLSDLPPGALITQASVSLTGRLNYLNASYPVSWTLGLLPDKFGGYEESQPLSSATYNDVHAATVTLATPAYDSRELGVGLGNTFALTAEQLAALNARRATTGRVTFRIDGPPGGPDNLFVWCGNAPIVNGAQNCTGASRPTLSLAFVVPAATFTPTTSPTPTATGTATPTPSPTGTATPSPTRTVTPSVTFTVTPGPTRTATATVTVTYTPSATASATAPPTRTLTPTVSPTASTTPTATTTPSPTATPTPGLIFVGHEPHRTYHTLADQLVIEIIDPDPFQGTLSIFSDSTPLGSRLTVRLQLDPNDPQRLIMTRPVTFCTACAGNDDVNAVLKVKDGDRIFVEYDRPLPNNAGSGVARWFSAPASPTPTVTLTPTSTATFTATSTATATATASPTTTRTPTSTYTPTVTLTATPSPTQTATATASPTPTPTVQFYFDQRNGYIGVDAAAVLTLVDVEMPLYCSLFPEVTAWVSSTSSPRAFQVTLRPIIPCLSVYTTQRLDDSHNIRFCTDCAASDPATKTLKVSDGDEIVAEYLDRIRPGLVHLARARWYSVQPTPTRTPTVTLSPTVTATPPPSLTPTATPSAPPSATRTPTSTATVPTPTPTSGTPIVYAYRVFLPLIQAGQ